MSTKKFLIGLLAFLTLLIGACASTLKQTNTSKFEYREIYLPEHGSSEYVALGLNNLDNEWGIWGHNLRQVLPHEPSNTIWAKIKGSTEKDQFCFSSPKLYEYICDFIIDNYGENGNTRFAILPNDNDLVCMCASCVALGNKAKDTSPALMALINRLAERFPSHTFFTSNYRTTKSAPKESLPPNTGVLISAINYPLSVHETNGEKKFIDQLKKWDGKVGKIYVWDYVNNFDDYFTPYPIFSAFQRRLKIYTDNGVDGIFFNGSGTDFSTFSRLKTHVLHAMMNNPEGDWKKILRQKAKEFYPETGDLIADFMIEQETYVSATGKELPLYQGISAALATYLPADEFIKFHEALTKRLPSLSGDERDDITRLVQALELTRLEIMRQRNDFKGYTTHLDNLSRLDTDTDVHVYSETCWPIKTYIADYRKVAPMVDRSNENLLLGIPLVSISQLDPDYTDLSYLTDGHLGMPSNYHNGLLINSPDDRWRFKIPGVPGMKTIRIWMAVNPAFRIGLPRKVVLLGNDRIIATKVPVKFDAVGHTYIDIDVPEQMGSYELSLERNREIPAMAVEEIQAFK